MCIIAIYAVYGLNKPIRHMEKQRIGFSELIPAYV